MHRSGKENEVMKSTMNPTTAQLEPLDISEEGTNTQTRISYFDSVLLVVRGRMAIVCLVVLILAIIDGAHYHLINVWLYVTVRENLLPGSCNEGY
jgi:hypothetical protein